ncbi:hypothetical protein OHA21_23700 [Actinoplanes sp. NBC_00393]|uniref:hypothetical protein n=1 Tax=Actinoplanes sp. NBC_00393 TaxID=2975953 RepID=UPI002E1FBBAD
MPGWVGVVLVIAAVVAVALGGSAILASRWARTRPGARAAPAAAGTGDATGQAAPDGLTGLAAVGLTSQVVNGPPGPAADDLAGRAADAEAVRAAAERAVAAADQARERAEDAAGRRDLAEKRYLDAKWEARASAADESQRLVQRAALDAYRRGELTVAQLNGIWQHTGSGAEPPVDPEVRAALLEYQQAMTESAQVSREAHVAEVAAEVLAEEVHIAEQDVLAAQEEARPGLDALLSRPEPGRA